MPAAKPMSLSPKWTTIRIHVGGSRRREYVQSSGSGGYRSRRSRETALQQRFRACRHCFPQAVTAPNILYTRFTNANAMLHVANCVANAGRIESGESYKFYAEGVTPAVARLYEAINGERVAVGAALGASVPTLADWFDRVYGVREATLVETCQRLPYNSDGPYQPTGKPKSLNHKFITEDVPTGLVPMSALGTAAGVRTPAIDALVEVVQNMTGKDFAAEGRTLERLGLSGMDGPQIRRVIEDGFS
jgi:opine dehydrogenase